MTTKYTPTETRRIIEQNANKIRAKYLFVKSSRRPTDSAKLVAEITTESYVEALLAQLVDSLPAKQRAAYLDRLASWNPAP